MATSLAPSNPPRRRPLIPPSMWALIAGTFVVLLALGFLALEVRAS